MADNVKTASFGEVSKTQGRIDRILKDLQATAIVVADPGGNDPVTINPAGFGVYETVWKTHQAERDIANIQQSWSDSKPSIQGAGISISGSNITVFVPDRIAKNNKRELISFSANRFPDDVIVEFCNAVFHYVETQYRNASKTQRKSTEITRGLRARCATDEEIEGSSLAKLASEFEPQASSMEDMQPPRDKCGSGIELLIENIKYNTKAVSYTLLEAWNKGTVDYQVGTSYFVPYDNDMKIPLLSAVIYDEGAAIFPAAGAMAVFTHRDPSASTNDPHFCQRAYQDLTRADVQYSGKVERPFIGTYAALSELNLPDDDPRLNTGDGVEKKRVLRNVIELGLHRSTLSAFKAFSILETEGGDISKLITDQFDGTTREVGRRLLDQANSTVYLPGPNEVLGITLSGVPMFDVFTFPGNLSTQVGQDNTPGASSNDGAPPSGEPSGEGNTGEIKDGGEVDLD
jgi:hypothetical protein